MKSNHIQEGPRRQIAGFFESGTIKIKDENDRHEAEIHQWLKAQARRPSAKKAHQHKSAGKRQPGPEEATCWIQSKPSAKTCLNRTTDRIDQLEHRQPIHRPGRPAVPAHGNCSRIPSRRSLSRSIQALRQLSTQRLGELGSRCSSAGGSAEASGAGSICLEAVESASRQGFPSPGCVWGR